jgi:hypothetical protein
MPDMNRTVEPEFPASSLPAGFRKPLSPRPSMTTVDPSRRIGTPSVRKHASVLAQSALSAKLRTIVVPSAMAPNIASR